MVDDDDDDNLPILEALRDHDRAAWADIVETAMKKAKGKTDTAASLLGVPPKVLVRWLSEKELAHVKASR